MFAWLKNPRRRPAAGAAAEAARAASTDPAAPSANPAHAAPHVDPEALLRRLEWKTVRVLDGLLQGDYKTLFRGEGMALAELREYQPHDDVRHIDWNATARMQVPYVREHQEDRDMSAWFLVDLSRSVSFGSGQTSKRMLATEFVGAMARILGRRGNRAGAMIYTGSLTHAERHIPPRAGRRHVLHLIDRVANTRANEPTGETDLRALLDDAMGSIKRRSTVFVISDFFTVEGWESSLARLARRHDVVAIRLTDPLETHLPDLVLVTIEDAETGEQVFIDTHDQAFRRRFEQLSGAREAALRAALTGAGVDCLELRTDSSLAASLTHFMALRKRRGQLAVSATRSPQAA